MHSMYECLLKCIGVNIDNGEKAPQLKWTKYVWEGRAKNYPAKFLREVIG